MCLSGQEEKKETYEKSFFIATLGETALKEGFKLLSSLRAQGLGALMDFSAKSLKSQMRSADKNKSRYVVILGDDELKKNVFVLKNMEDGSQKELPLEDAAGQLKRMSS